MRMAVIGGGSWGTALAHLMAEKGLSVTLFVRETEAAESINRDRENTIFLPGLKLSPSLTATSNPEQALQGADICLLVTPSQFMRQTLRSMAHLVPEKAVPVCASKGIEMSSLSLMSRVVADEWPKNAAGYAILSGPSFAKEVVLGSPTAVVLGCEDASQGERLREVFSTPRFRVYSCSDVVGVELGGAVKNVIAIAAGVCDGLELGYNARAGLITRGLAEMSRLGEAMGGKASTFMGLSGMGDLVLTCTGDLSRNRQVGLRLAAGETLEHISGSTKSVAEGVKTTEAVCALAEKLGVELPLADAMRRILAGKSTAGEMVRELMTRALKDE